MTSHYFTAKRPLFDRIQAQAMRALIVPDVGNFQAGDRIVLSAGFGETMQPTEHKVCLRIDHVLTATPGLAAGYCLLSISPIEP